MQFVHRNADTKMLRSCATLITVVLLIALVGCNSTSPDSISDEQDPVTGTADTPRLAASESGRASQDSHARMLDLLGQIRIAAHRDSNQYFANAEAKNLRAKLSALPAGSPQMEKLRLKALLGIRELLMGHIKESIEQLTTAYAMVPELEDQFDSYPIRLPLLIGLAYLRKAEVENCVEHHTSASCLFPISENGVHAHPDGARSAIPFFTSVLQRRPDDLTARWLLNLAYMVVGEHPDKVPTKHLIAANHFESEVEFPRFPDVAAELGVNTFSHCGGAIAEDLDGDGWLDIVASTWSPSGQIRYFGNNRDGKFQERTDEAGLSGLYGGLNLVQADYDNDGDIDILVLRGAWLDEKGQYPNSLLENDGHGRFRDVTFDVGLGDVQLPTQTAAWADYDNDGDLDLYVGNEGFPGQLFQNDGKKKFRDVARSAGVLNYGRAKAVGWGDYDNDRYPDLYVSNQGQENRLYHNNGDGTFTDVARKAGVVAPVWGFPTWFWDFNNDGALDIYASSYNSLVEHIAADYLGLPQSSERDCLYEGDGKGSFKEVAQERGLTRPTAPMGSNFGDLDHDGFLDFYLGTGYPEYEQLMPNLMFRNRGGTRFDDVTTAGGFGHLQKGHGVTFADFDHDGDQDVFIEMGGAYAGDAFWNALFQNPGFGNHSITLKLVGQESNRCAIGARIKIEIEEQGTSRSIYRWVSSGGSFGGNPLRQQIGLGQATTVGVLEIFWPTTGRTDRYTDIPADQFLEITEGNKEPRIVAPSTDPLPAERGLGKG
jgi:hypothetical protein